MLEATIRTDLGRLVESMDQAGLFGTGGIDRFPEGAAVVPYRSSFRRHRSGALFLVRTPQRKFLVTVDLNGPFDGENLPSVNGRQIRVCPLTAENAAVLRAELPFTAPAKLAVDRPSFGCGDRLGLANAGHLRVLRGYRVSPVLAQQSIRELNLTGRTFGEVIDAASWAALQEGYEDGFGADGDHLKTLDEVKMVLAAGASMVTLDLSLCLGVPEQPGPCPAELRAQAGQVFASQGVEVRPKTEEIEEFWRTYWAAIAFVEQAEAICRSERGAGRYDLEVSVDETAHTTRPVDHFLLAFELRRRGISPFSVAPRFPGEFQKGIDYLGDLDVFAAEFRMHAVIANHFGYRLSIHSGSDKFAIFPVAARLTGGLFHEKTAGTSWLEAMRVVAQRDPALFRRIYGRARGFFPEAKKYYHIKTELEHVPAIEESSDGELPELLNLDAPRQFLHITYGQIVQAPDLGPDFFRLLHAEEASYYGALATHFRRHVEGLGIAEK